MSLTNFIAQMGAAGNAPSGPSFDLTLTGRTGGYSTFITNIESGANAGIGGWVSNFYYFQWPFTLSQPIPFTARQAEGSAGNGGSAAGNGYVVTGTLTASSTSYIYILAGNTGHVTSISVPSDGTGGGGGGATQMLIGDPSFPATYPYFINGMYATSILSLNGTGGGNDATYQGYQTAGPIYQSLVAWNGWTPVTNNGISYTRVATAYGGYPNGNAQDDAVSNGGGPVTGPGNIRSNYYDSTYISNASISFAYSGTSSGGGNNAGFIHLGS